MDTKQECHHSVVWCWPIYTVEGVAREGRSHHMTTFQDSCPIFLCPLGTASHMIWNQFKGWRNKLYLLMREIAKSHFEKMDTLG